MRPLSLYLHLPFCVRKCRYCDFLSHPAPEEEIRAYVRTLCAEAEQQGMKYGGRTVDTVFFGGGTPSLLSGELFGEIMQRIFRCFKVEPGAEITMECNPGTLTYENITRCRQEGVNRLSIGAQSFLDKELLLLGRIHRAIDIEESFALARSVGFRNISLDLMSALPGQTTEDFLYSVRKAIDLSPEHLSVYSLITEEGTELGDAYLDGSYVEKGWSALPDEDTERAMVHETARCLKEAGYEQYEISNYAKPGFSSRHNTGYWTGHDYLGLGIGAASKIGNTRFSNPSDTATYQRLIVGQQAEEARDVQLLSKKEEMEEFCFLGLRMTEGISTAVFERTFGAPFEEVYGEVLAKHLQTGLLAKEGDNVFLTERGLDLANRVMADFLLD